MKKIIILPFLMLFVLTLIGCTNSAPADQVSVEYKDTTLLDATIKKIKTDKEIYHPQEKISVTVALQDIKGSGQLLLEIVGLTDSYGDNWIEKRENISIADFADKEYTQEFVLPNSASCDGLIQGKYPIKVALSDNDVLLSENKTYISFRP